MLCLLISYLLFWDNILHCNPIKPRIYYVAQSSLKLTAISCLSLSVGIIGVTHHIWRYRNYFVYCYVYMHVCMLQYACVCVCTCMYACVCMCHRGGRSGQLTWTSALLLPWGFLDGNSGCQFGTGVFTHWSICWLSASFCINTQLDSRILH